MPYLVKGKCIFKKNANGSQGDKIGCTTGDISKYIKALYANGKETEGKLIKEFLNHIKKRMVMENENMDTHGHKKFRGSIKNEAGKWMAVIKPGIHHELSDCLIETDPFHFSHHLNSGNIDEASLHGIYKSKSKAKSIAEKLLKERDKGLAAQNKANQMKVKQLEQEIQDLKDLMKHHLDKASDEPGTADANHADASAILDQIKEKETELKDLQ